MVIRACSKDIRVEEQNDVAEQGIALDGDLFKGLQELLPDLWIERFDLQSISRVFVGGVRGCGPFQVLMHDGVHHLVHDQAPAGRRHAVRAAAAAGFLQSLDLALRIGPLSERGVIARRVGHVRRVLFASAGYLARRGSPRSPRDLTKHDIVYVAHRPSPTEWRFRAQGREQVVRLAPRFMVSDIDTAILAAKAGSGIARALSYQVASDFSRGTLVRVLREFEPAAWPVNLVVPTAQHMPRMVRAFLDMAAPALDALQVIHDERR